MIDITSEIKSLEQKNIFSKISSLVKAIGFEGLIWITALLYLAFFVNPFHTHFTICPLSNLGFEHCPGCGLGNSIALIFRGDIMQSFDTHILGIPALLIILNRIFLIIKFNLTREQIHNQ